MVIVAVTTPWSRRNVSDIDELPIGHVRWCLPEVIAHRRRNIEPGPVVEIRFRALVSKNILKMIRPERTAIFPLRVASPIAFSNSHPVMPADRLPLARVGLLEPRNDQRRLGLELAVRHVVVGQRAIEWILPGNERHRDVVSPRRGFRVIKATVIVCPICVPAASVIRHRVVSASLFSNPEDCRDNVRFPWKPRCGRARSGRYLHHRLDLQERLIAQFHRILRKIRRGRIWGTR